VDVFLKPKEAKTLLPTDILFQTVFWSQVKARLGWKALAFDFSSSSLRGDVLVLIRALGNDIKAAYVPQGPEFGPGPDDYGLFLEALSDAMISELEPEVAFIRYDLPWESHYAQDIARGERSAPPEARLLELRMNFGTKSWNLRKMATNMTVADTYIVDLARPKEQILQKMQPKTRYNIRLSDKKGIRVFPAPIELLPLFYELYRQTAVRNGFYLCEYGYFLALFSALACDPDSAEVHLLLAAKEQDLLAGAIITISGKTATYLFGASSSEKRNLMGPYAVHWAGMCLASSRGCHTYDMGAVSPIQDPT